MSILSGSTALQILIQLNRFVSIFLFSFQLIFYLKGELEHRSPKARYTRTSRKGFIKQMTQIERRQARIR
jgi:hypothetical protein